MDTDNRGRNLISMGGNKVIIKTSMAVVGSDTELPIEITANFENIPSRLHEKYIRGMMTSYGIVNLYDNT